MYSEIKFWRDLQKKRDCFFKKEDGKTGRSGKGRGGDIIQQLQKGGLDRIVGGKHMGMVAFVFSPPFFIGFLFPGLIVGGREAEEEEY